MKVGIYGGTFNPPHIGHVRSAKAAISELKQKKWTREISGILDEIAVGILHGEFKKVVSAVERVSLISDGAAPAE